MKKTIMLLTSIVGLVADIIAIIQFLAHPPTFSIEVPAFSIDLGPWEVVLFSGILLVYGLIGASYMLIKPFRAKYVKITGTTLEGKVSFLTGLAFFPILYLWFRLAVLTFFLHFNSPKLDPLDPAVASSASLWCGGLVAFLFAVSMGGSGAFVMVGETLYDLLE